MFFSAYHFYYDSTLYRFLLQKHYSLVPSLSKLSFRVSNTNVDSTEDFEILHALKSLEELSGQKSSLKYVGSRYVGTTKRAYYLAMLNLRKESVFFVLEILSLLFITNFQKRFGRFDSSIIQRSSFALCCKDLQLFQNYYFSSLRTNFLISFQSFGSSILGLLDILQCFKFNIKQ
jgi:hypothetical protein